MVLALEDVRHQLEQSIVDTIQFPGGWGGNTIGEVLKMRNSQKQNCAGLRRGSRKKQTNMSKLLKNSQGHRTWMAFCLTAGRTAFKETQGRERF